MRKPAGIKEITSATNVVIAAIIAFLTAIGICIAAVALIPAFGQWLSPREPRPYSATTATAIASETSSLLENPLAETDGIVWQASFYGNKELKEPITLQGHIRGARNGLRVDWGNGSPGGQTPEDFFSAIFATTHNFVTGNYCFVIEVDDGARLFVDGEEIRSVWWGYTPGAVYKTPKMLDEGTHNIQFYYYEEFEKASLHLYWYPNAGSECVTVGHPGIP